MTAEIPGALPPTDHERHAATERATTDQAPRAAHRDRLGTVRDAVVSFIGAVMAIVPHVMHHIGLFVGAAFLTGAGGNALFYVIGLVFSIPLLRRLHRRFATWRGPAIAIAVFTAVFSFSALVIGPAISGGSTPTDTPSSPTDPQPQTPDHHGH